MSVKDYEGPALFSYGFRPFFLLGSIYVALAILVWLPVFFGELEFISIFAPRDWHIHEMLYGYLPAVITGFLFTAIPNWTGRVPLRGRPLMFLVAVWGLGRVAITFSVQAGWIVTMLVDASFLLLVAAAAAREIVAGRKWHNLSVVATMVLLSASNVGFHLEAHVQGAADISVRLGIAIVILLISLIGGRIVPSFTRNWLVRENPGRLPVAFARFDVLTVAIGAISLLCWIVWPDRTWTGLLFVLAGFLHVIRLGRWAGDRVVRERLLLILHVGYAFVPLGFLLNACGILGLMPTSAGVHAWMAGAAGIMTLAVMTRASLGHTGQQLTASVTTQVIYACIVVAAVARICAVLEPNQSVLLLHIAALGWSAAFLGFALTYAPTLVGYSQRSAPPPVHG